MTIKGNKSHGEDTRNQVEQVFQALLDHQDKTGSLRNILVRDLWQTVNTKEKKEAVKKEEIKRAFGDLVTLKILIDERGSKRQGAHLWHFDLKLECAHDREASLKEFRQRWEKQWGAGKAPAQKRAEKPQLPTNARTIDYGPYLRSLINDSAYQRTWGFYTPTDARTQTQPSPIAPELDFELMAQLLPAKQDPENTQEKPEPLPVLSAMEQYAAEHVLLIGRPGSGKSTALRRLLIDKAKLALEDTLAPIPVLVELRYLDAKKPSALNRIQDFLRSHDLHLEEATLIQELQAGRFLLLIDGVNELPSEVAHQKAIAFRKVYGKTAMVFSTRDITLNGDLGIHNKLEMQPLSKLQMEQFVKAYLPEQGNAMLRQLQEKLRQVSETPLFLWMLCAVFQQCGEVPSSLGLLFQIFTAQYDQLKQKEGALVSQNFRQWQANLLEELAWQMMQAKEPTELQVAISQTEAEAVLEIFLISKKVDCPAQRAKEWLQDLLEHHLLQRASHSHIEFHHQLFQEYYAAKVLGQRLQFLSDEELKRNYLNYLKWTEPFGLLLSIIDDDSQALRVVRLALNEVDLMLGAKLSGKVKSELQETTLDYIDRLEIPLQAKIKLLEKNQSDYAISKLSQALDHSNRTVRRAAIRALENLKSLEAIGALIKSLDHPDPWRQEAALSLLGSTKSSKTILPNINTLHDSGGWVSQKPFKISRDKILTDLISALHNSDNWVQKIGIVENLRRLGDPKVLSQLWKEHLQPSDSDFYYAIADIQERCGFYNDDLIQKAQNLDSDRP